jgi:hypothetical protein
MVAPVRLDGRGDFAVVEGPLLRAAHQSGRGRPRHGPVGDRLRHPPPAGRRLHHRQRLLHPGRHRARLFPLHAPVPAAPEGGMEIPAPADRPPLRGEMGRAGAARAGPADRVRARPGSGPGAGNRLERRRPGEREGGRSRAAGRDGRPALGRAHRRDARTRSPSSPRSRPCRASSSPPASRATASASGRGRGAWSPTWSAALRRWPTRRRSVSRASLTDRRSSSKPDSSLAPRRSAAIPIAPSSSAFCGSAATSAPPSLLATRHICPGGHHGPE